MKRISDFKNLLSKPISKKYIDDIVESIHKHPEDLQELYILMDDNNIKVAWKATWACEKLSELHPDWFIMKYKDLTKRLLESKHDGSKRLLLSILYNLPVPEPFPVEFLDYCLNHMFATEESIGVQALCIKSAYKLCKNHPELLWELKINLENSDLEYYSKGVQTCARKVLKILS